MARMRAALQTADLPVEEGLSSSFWLDDVQYTIRADFTAFWTVTTTHDRRTHVDGSFLLRNGRFEVIRSGRWVDAGADWRLVVREIIERAEPTDVPARIV